MSQNQLAELLLEASREAGKRLQAQSRNSPEWIQAQRDLVRIRADYWDEMRKVWDGTDRPPPALRRGAPHRTAEADSPAGRELPQG